MEIVAVVVGLALLYLWLAGHWFGRVLAFVAWGAAFTFLAGAIAEGRGAIGIPLFLGGWVGAWFLAKAPSIYWNKRINEGWRAAQS